MVGPYVRILLFRVLHEHLYIGSILLRFVRAREPPSPHPVHPPPLVSQQPGSKNRTGIPPSIYNTSQGHITLLSRSSINTTAWRSWVDPATNILFATPETDVRGDFCGPPSISHNVYSLINCEGSVADYIPFWDAFEETNVQYEEMKVKGRHGARSRHRSHAYSRAGGQARH